MRFPWRSLLMLLLTVCGGIFIFDIYFHNGFKHSKTNKVLTETGILMFLTQVWNRVCLYSAKALVWLQKNIPYYWAQSCAFLAPYLQKLWELLYDLGIYIVNVTQPARLWLNENVPKAFEWVNAQLPWLWEYTLYYWNIVWMFVWQNSVWLWQHIIYYFNVASTWLLQNVFTGSLSPENIQKTLGIVLTTIHTYLMAIFQWCYNLVQSASQSSTQS